MAGAVLRVPGYVIEVPLGRGGSAGVWRARSKADGEAVAVKLLPAPDADELAVLSGEAAVLSALDHPHLIRLRDAVPCDSGLALVLDLADGGSLAALLAARGRLSPGEVVTALAPIGAALAYAHTAGVVHGDVSAGNVLFSRVGFPLLADLGVARLAGDTAPVRSTPAYVDPVVAAGGVPIPASDVFMLGGVALHALTGAPPWPDGPGTDPMAAAVAGPLHDVRARLAAARVPEAVTDVVVRALALDPDRRPTAAEFALDLRHAAEPVAVDLDAGRGPRHAAEPPFTRVVRRSPPAAPPRPARRRVPGGARVGVGVLAAGAVALGAALWLRPATGHGGPGAARRLPPRSAPGISSRPPVSATAPAGASSAGTGLDAAGAARTLALLDAARARAYAARDPRLLAQVYLPGPLLTADSATMTRLVPDGCGLVGVRTEYRRIAVTGRAPGRTVLTLEARLSPSRVECSGAVTGHAPGTGPTPLSVVLRATDSGYRIESITR